MKRYLMTGLAVLLMSSAAWAEEVKVHVKGMVCAFCAQGIEHALKEQKSVGQVKVDLDNGLVTVQTQDKGALSDATIGDIITDAGFTVEEIERI
jgi:copper chaperone CopZ